jgi:cation diffusion facilitator family transporter
MQLEPKKTRIDLTRFAWMSIATALLTIGLKAGAYFLTGSVGLLSDAAESIVNLVAAVVALVALRVAALPPGEGHHFGRTKAEYLSAAVEGIMIFVAAAFIIAASVERLINPQPLEQVGVGLAVSMIASVLNGITAFTLMRAGRKYNSMTLSADGKHLLTDVWTSVGVVVGVGLVALSGWWQLDPIVALLVGLNIIWTGWHLISQSLDGLMDHSMSPEEHAKLAAALDEFASEEVLFHAVRTRVAGHLAFIEMHVLVPGDWSIQRGHDLVEDVQTRIEVDFPECEVMTHLEPLEDPRSHEGFFNSLDGVNKTQ